MVSGVEPCSIFPRYRVQLGNDNDDNTIYSLPEVFPNEIESINTDDGLLRA